MHRQFDEIILMLEKNLISNYYYSDFNTIVDHLLEHRVDKSFELISKRAKILAKDSGSMDVPMQLRNAPTSLMKEMGYGKDYRYAHDEADAYAAGETYFPDELGEQEFYHPVERGLEIKIKQKLDYLRSQNKKAGRGEE